MTKFNRRAFMSVAGIAAAETAFSPLVWTIPEIRNTTTARKTNNALPFAVRGCATETSLADVSICAIILQEKSQL